MSIDVEEWYHVDYLSKGILKTASFESRLRANMDVLLKTLSDHQARATFFFLGIMAEQYPDLVSETRRLGHEIASHGYGHQLVYKLSRDEFRQDVRKSLDILQDLSGEQIKGYRAPFWSISKATPWAYEVLAGLGLVYDASLFPFTTYLYGDSQALAAPFVLDINGQKFYEIPASVVQLGRLRLPFGGGFYFRAMPFWATRLATYITNQQGRVVVFYLHPREIDPAHPRMELPPSYYFASYLNLKTTLRKLKRLLKTAPTISISQFLNNRDEEVLIK